MNNVFIEENGAYSIDCSNAVWASDRMHKDYHDSGIHINDVDFLIEDASHIFMVEYKNANFSGAVNPEAFQPLGDKKISIVTRKFYDSLHYLKLLTQTSHIKNGICSLKNQYFSSQNSAQAAAELHSNAFCMYFGSL